VRFFNASSSRTAVVVGVVERRDVHEDVIGGGGNRHFYRLSARSKLWRRLRRRRRRGVRSARRASSLPLDFQDPKSVLTVHEPPFHMITVVFKRRFRFGARGVTPRRRRRSGIDHAPKEAREPESARFESHSATREDAIERRERVWRTNKGNKISNHPSLRIRKDDTNETRR